MLDADCVSEGESPTLNVITCRVLKPGLTFRKSPMVRRSRPAPTSNTSVSAI
jgi:hypothetical protein